MQAQLLKNFDRRIRHLQAQLARLGPLRPGTLTRQYRRPQRQQGAYYQLSYTYRMKSHTEYVPKAQVAMVRQEIAAYHRYKKLTAQWIALALRRSRLRRQLTRSATPQPGAKSSESRSNVGRSTLKNPAKSRLPAAQ
jgi:hypothetical protein